MLSERRRQQQQQQSWKLQVTAKANNFNFRLRFAAATYKPTWNFSFFRLSILLKLPKFALRFASHPTQHRPGFFATKFMKIVHKLRPRFPRKKESNVSYPKVNNLTYQDPLRVGFWVMGILARVARSISNNGQRGIVMLGSVGYLLLLFWRMKTVNLVAFLVVIVFTV
ncbi:hypothetical protein DEO72_LG10g3342 [Vigna unguiculata]|uniref:Uncharacterized protein n=1 Tax=Vigna unguiculata TaxID=3917 RepID=A0A4D6NGM7_VIGUN|nr:hypothetical protein DEO72_LG10g3342 [Vigna unguiculata]